MPEETIPLPIVEAIEAGISPTKAFRIYSDTTIPELAEATSLSAGRICMIEAGFVPTRGEASAIREALHMPVRTDLTCF